MSFSYASGDGELRMQKLNFIEINEVRNKKNGFITISKKHENGKNSFQRIAEKRSKAS